MDKILPRWPMLALLTGIVTAPAVAAGPSLSFSTYLGGSDFDQAYAVTTDTSGNIYVTGQTASTNFPLRSGGQSGNRDVFVVKLDSTGAHVLYTKILGGSQADFPRGIAVDASGNAYVTGYTTSTDFPITTGAYRTAAYGLEDAFVFKLNSTGALVYSTYLGGAGRDFATGIAVDTGGNAYVTGYTSSTNFPITIAGALQSSYSGGFYDSFVTKLNAAGSALVYSTYLGGAGNDTASAIAVDSYGYAYIAGQTDSLNFPLSTPYQSSNAGGTDAFVIKLSTSGAALIFSTYLGGSSNDLANGIAVDSSHNVYVAGVTASTDFPTSATAYQHSVAGMFDAFVAKLSAAGTTLMFSTLLGGSGSDQANGIAVDSANNVWLAGSTSSTNFPLANPLQTRPGGGNDAFIATVNATGDQLLFSSYVGGGMDDLAAAIAIDNKGAAIAAGYTESPNFPTTAGVLQPAFGGSYDGFVLKLQTGLCPYTVSPTSLNVGSGGASGGITITTPSGCSGTVTAASNVAWASVSVSNMTANWSVLGNSSFQARNGTLTVAGETVTIAQAGGTCVYTLTPTSVNTGAGAGSGNINVTPVPSDCPTAAVNSVMSWISVGINGNTVTWSVTANPSAQGRSGTFTAGGQTVTIVQSGAACSYAVNPSSVSAGPGGGTGNIAIAPSPSDCPAAPASSGVSWASVLVSGTNAGWSISGNPSSQGRNSNFTIGGQNVAVSQPGAACSYSLSSSSVNVGASGSSGNIGITPSPSDCPAAAANSGVSWASVSVSGNTAPWSVAANSSSQNRGGSFTIGGQTVSISQAAAGCSYALGSSAVNVASSGSTGNIGITPTPSDCPVPAASSSVGWASISASATNAAWSVTANSAPQGRSGNFSVAGQSIPLAQAGTGVTPTLALSRTSLNFGASGSTITSPQGINVTFTGGSAAWTASSNQSNIQVSPASGNGSGSFTVTASAGAGGVVTVSAPGTTNSQVQVQVNINNVTAATPVGSFDTPASGTAGIAGALAITGWALDNIEVTKVDIWREPVGAEPSALVYLGDAVFVAGARPDVETANPNAPFNYRAGWGYLLLTNFLPNSSGSGLGNGTYKLHAIAHNKTGGTQDFGAHQLTVDNTHASKPFGTIDTPGQGATISGSSYVNFGWALTQNPYAIPTDGSTITVYLDGQPLGHPVYNQNRSDITTLFPGLANSNGAIGYFVIDTTKYTNGVHSIDWIVYDNQNRGDGIGSRYFTILNGGAVAATEEAPIEEFAGVSDASVQIEELGRIQIDVGAITGYMLVGNEKRPLPPGSSLRDGIFYWQPGPGFLGEYQLVLGDRRVRVRIGHTSR